MKNLKIRSHFLYTILMTVLFSLTSCNDFKEELHTIEECRNFKKGDTIFVRKFYSVKRCVVINNYPNKELIEVRDLRYEWDIDILYYDDFRFKNRY